MCFLCSANSRAKWAYIELFVYICFPRIQPLNKMDGMPGLQREITAFLNADWPCLNEIVDLNQIQSDLSVMLCPP